MARKLLEKQVLLKWLIVIGGWFEVAIGILFQFLHLFLADMGIEVGPPIFLQLSGAMFICFGLLLIISARDMEKYAVIPKINALLRFLVQPATIYNMIIVPEFVPLLLGATIYDIAWAIIVLYLLRKLEY